MGYQLQEHGYLNYNSKYCREEHLSFLICYTFKSCPLPEIIIVSMTLHVVANRQPTERLGEIFCNRFLNMIISTLKYKHCIKLYIMTLLIL